MRVGWNHRTERSDISWLQWNRHVLALTDLDSTLGAISYLLCDPEQED